MNQEVNLNNKRKKLKLYYGLLITVICIIGVSFAWFRLYLSQNEDNTLASRTCFNTTLTENTSKIEITDAFPISDEDGLKQTPFTFTLKNNCSSYVKAYILIESTYRANSSTSYLSDNYLKVNVSPKNKNSNPSVILGTQTLTDIENSSKGYVLATAYLGTNEEKSFDLRIWMDSAVTLDQGLNKRWAGKIVVITDASNKPTFVDTILADNKVTSPITIPGSDVSAQKLEDIKEETYVLENINTSEKYDATKGNIYPNLLGINSGSHINREKLSYADSWTANGDNFDLSDPVTINSSDYDSNYSSLVGKFIYWQRIGHRDDDMYVDMASEMSIKLNGISGAGNNADGSTSSTTTNLNEIFYVTKAGTKEITYKTLTSNKSVTESLFASTEDDYGYSYYFRGNVKNNYVEFANKCWRIVRITGNNLVKLVLHNNNSNGVSNPCSESNNDSTAAFIGTSAYNDSYNDEAYVGFMYGQTGSTDYGTTYANTNKSTILNTLETWYKENLAPYESKLADTIWCNDKSTGIQRGLASDVTNYYEPNNRLESSKTATLKCPNDNNECKLSKLTTSDTINGNGNLTYKIGLLTADETAYAGLSVGKINPLFYLTENASGGWWWTLSPHSYNLDIANVYTVIGKTGTLVSRAVNLDMYVRPAIALNTSIEVTGSGTSEDPYIVK